LVDRGEFSSSRPMISRASEEGEIVHGAIAESMSVKNSREKKTARPRYHFA
jgi:hypothetical protein